MNSGQVANNIILVLLSRCIEVVSGLLTVGLLARYLGVQEFGEYAFIMALVWTALPVLSTGIPRILVREIAQQRDSAERHVKEGLTLNCIMILALVPALLLFSPALETYKTISCMIAFLVVSCMTLTQTTNSVFAAFGRFQYETVTSLAIMVSLLLFIVGVIYFDLGFVSIFAAMAAAYLIGLLVSVSLSYRLAGFVPKPTLQFTGLSYLFKESLPLGVYQLLMQLFLYAGVFMLKAFADESDVALFQAPLKIHTGFMVIPMSLMAPLLPVLSQQALTETGRKDLAKTVETLVKSLITISMTLTIMGVTLAREVIPLIYGQAFVRSISGLKIMLFGASFFFLNIFFVTLSVACRRQKNLIFLTTAGLAFCALLNMILIPDFGYRGSALALTISSGFICTLYVHLFWDLFQSKFILKTGSIMALGLLLTGALQFFSDRISIFSSLSLGLSLFFAGLFAFRMLTVQEIAPITGLLRKRKPAAFK